MADNDSLPFTIAEYRDRLDGVRREMAAAGVAVMLVTAPENIYYLTGYQTVGYFSFQVLVVSLEQDPIMLTRGINESQARRDSWLDAVASYGDTEDAETALMRVLDEHGLAGARLGNQDADFFFTVAQYKRLVARLGAEPVDCSGLVERVRLIKSPAELVYMREAGRCCAAAMDGAAAAARAGVTENDVAAALHHALFAAGSEYLGHAPLVIAGAAGGFGMDTYRRRLIADNDVLFLEVGGTYERYNAALSRTVIIGNPGKQWTDMVETCREGYNRAREAIKPGATAHDVDGACRDVIVARGYPFEKRVGYSIGIGFPPDWGESRIQSINRGDRTELRPGMVFHLIPSLRLPGEGGVVFSETVAVTETGSEVLTPYDQAVIFK